VEKNTRTGTERMRKAIELHKLAHGRLVITNGPI